MLTRLAVSALVVAGAFQISFEQAIGDLASADANVRLRAVEMLKDAAYPEAVLPLAKLVADPEDAIQLEAIAAELNIFLAEKVVTKKRVGIVVEKRSAITAEALFSSGPLAVGGGRAPRELLTTLRAAMRDDNPRVSLEALYAFGTIAPGVSGAERRDLLRAVGPELASLMGAPDPFMRFGAARVMGRVFARRAGDEPIDQTVGDSVVAAVNDRDHAVKIAAMQALGAMRYDRAVNALAELFTYHAKGDQAEASLDALAHIANPASGPLLGTQLTSKTPSLRGIAVEGIARMGEPARLPDMQIALRGEKADTVLLALAFANTMLANAAIDPISEAVTRTRLRDQARQYLFELAPGRVGLFNKQVQDLDARVRLAAVDALGLTGDPAALPLVQPLATDKDPIVARAAAHAVDRLTAGR